METLHNWQTTLLSSTPSILSTSTKETTMIQCAHLHPNYRGAYRFQRCTFSPIIPLRCATHTINIQSILTKFNNQSTFFIHLLPPNKHSLRIRINPTIHYNGYNHLLLRSPFDPCIFRIHQKTGSNREETRFMVGSSLRLVIGTRLRE